MARRHKNTINVLVELAALMPWWAGLAIAVASYLALNSFAEAPPVRTDDLAPVSHLFTATTLRAIASVGQYVVPMVCTMGAILSVARSWRRRHLITGVAASRAPDALNELSWRDFERLVSEAFRLEGFQVMETGLGGADGGVDLILGRPSENGRERYLVQCKQWRASRVGVQIVRELYGVMTARGAAGGMVVTSGSFTNEAEGFANGLNIQLIDGRRLYDMIHRARNGEIAASAAFSPVQSLPSTQSTVDAAAPDCPICGETMAKRVARRGPRAGNRFWGCSSYPACRGTRPIT